MKTDNDAKKFAEMLPTEVISVFDSNLETGLSNSAVGSLQTQHGRNKLNEGEKEAFIWKYLEQFKEPLILLLLGSATLSALVGQYDDAFSIAAAVVIVGSVASYQEYKSEQSLEALNDLVPHRCTVVRGGKTFTLLAEELVPGDIVRLSSGDRVPADLRIISCISLEVDESSLTGETEPRLKTSEAVHDLTTEGDVSQYINLLFMGTLVCSGNGVGVVIAIGSQTEIGKTFEEMKDIESRRTPLQTKMDELGKRLSIFSIGIIVCIGAIGMLQGKSFLSMFNIGVSLAVAAIPEGLPICVAVTLALGVMRMAKKNAIVKQLPAVEALGCADIICSDKTGTLTENKMTVLSAYCPTLEDFVKFHQVKGSHVSQLRESFHRDTFYSDSGVEIKYHDREIDASRLPCLFQLFDCLSMCNNAVLSHGHATGQPTEIALLVAAAALNIRDRRDVLPRAREVAFSSENKVMQVAYIVDENNGKRPTEHIYVKGALEVVLPQCVTYFSGNGELALLTSTVIERVNEFADTMAKEGLRVLAAATGTKQNQLVFCGIVGLRDPLRAEVVEAVHRIKATGARVMMITGDSESTALSIGRLAGIYDPALNHKVLSGREIEDLARGGRENLGSVMDNVVICYRTAPRQKLCIVQALQAKGHVNFITFQLSTSVAALSLVAINNLLGRPNPLNPMQILWINIIMDGPLAQSLGVELVDPQVMQRPPRSKNDDIITVPLLRRVVSSGILILIGTLFIFIHEMDEVDPSGHVHENHSDPSEGQHISARDLTMTFTTFVMFDMFNAWTCQLLVLYVSPFQRVFRTVPLSMIDVLTIVALTSTMVILDSIRKKYFPSIFTEVINSEQERNAKKGVKDVHNEAFSV
eukprot:gene7633-8435_t